MEEVKEMEKDGREIVFGEGSRPTVELDVDYDDEYSEDRPIHHFGVSKVTRVAGAHPDGELTWDSVTIIMGKNTSISLHKSFVAELAKLFDLCTCNSAEGT